MREKPHGLGLCLLESHGQGIVVVVYGGTVGLVRNTGKDPSAFNLEYHVTILTKALKIMQIASRLKRKE